MPRNKCYYKLGIKCDCHGTCGNWCENNPEYPKIDITKLCPYTQRILECDHISNQECLNGAHCIIAEEKRAKPPLGIMPKHIHDEQRQEELKQAINRYFEANKPIPVEWIEEYNELVGDKK